MGGVWYIPLMATRLNKRQADSTRLKIQTSQLINRLTDHINGTVELSSTQVRAAEILLKKSLPDLTSQELTGDLEGVVKVVAKLAD